MSPPFSKWWKCPKKHFKRLEYWIPEAKHLLSNINGTRPFRYFTLCSREMIDIFSFIKEGIISHEGAQSNVPHVTFCERDEAIFPEIKEMIGNESAGFLGSLDEIVLFQDDSDSEQLTTTTQIDLKLDQLGEEMPDEQRKRLMQKQLHLTLKETFPFDFLNLDFCEPYYPNPPETMRVNSTVRRLVEWQTRYLNIGNSRIPINQFLLAVTCRYDETLSPDAYSRLQNIIKENQRRYPSFKEALGQNPIRKDTDSWQQQNAFDFFLTAWPKELLEIMEENQWDMTTVGLVYYDRPMDSEGKKYVIVSLLCNCQRGINTDSHENEAIKLLEGDARKKIEDFQADSQSGKKIKKHLKQVATLRNKRARFIQRPTLAFE